VRRLVVLGSTGSIGRSTLEVVEHLEDVQVVGLSARRNVDVLAAQAARFHPQAVAVEDPGQARRLQGLLPAGIEVLAGRDGVAALAAHPGADLVLVAVVGIAGLLPTLTALRAGKDVALATKEALVAGGSLVTAQARASGKMLLPVDSEHSAIFQCLQGTPRRRCGGSCSRLPAGRSCTGRWRRSPARRRRKPCLTPPGRWARKSPWTRRH